MSRTLRPTAYAALVPAAVLFAALAVGCDGTPGPGPTAAGTNAGPSAASTSTARAGTAPTSTPGAGTGPPRAGPPPAGPPPAGPPPAGPPPAGPPPAGPPRAGPSTPAHRTVAPPAARPGALADSNPTGSTGWVARLWFGGVPVDRDAAKLVVAYAEVDVASDGTRTVAHAKLALFACARRARAGSPNFVGCTGRRVEYGDLATPALRVSVSPAGAFTVAGTVPTYSYGGAVDRGTGLPVRWTGRAFGIQVRCAPDPQPVCRPGRRGGGTVVIFGADARAGRAGLDFGYLNRLSR